MEWTRWYVTFFLILLVDLKIRIGKNVSLLLKKKSEAPTTVRIPKVLVRFRQHFCRFGRRDTNCNFSIIHIANISLSIMTWMMDKRVISNITLWLSQIMENLTAIYYRNLVTRCSRFGRMMTYWSNFNLNLKINNV